TAGGAETFRRLAALAPSGSGAERAVILLEGGSTVAWAGTLRVPLDSLTDSLGVVATPFYDVLYAARERDGRRAVATVLLRARPPADTFTTSLADEVIAGTDAAGIEFAVADVARGDSADAALRLPDGSWLVGELSPLVPEEVALRTRERARGVGLALLALIAASYLGALWQGGRAARFRLAGLAAVLAAGALVPLNTLSNVTSLFDPSFYFAPLGGPYTASVGALGITSGLLLLALFAIPRRTGRRVPRVVAALVALLVVTLGPFLLRDLARGIHAPVMGVPTELWIAWEMALFLAATVVLVVGATAGRALLGRWRGLPPAVAPAIAAVGAFLAQPLWEAPGSWPAWYPLVWIVAVAALALTRRTRGLVLVAGAVAALGAMTLVWGTTARRRVELARRDVQGLTQPDKGLPLLLERYAADLAAGAAPTTRAELLASYAASDLAAAEYAVQLVAWSPAGVPVAELTDAAGVEPGATLRAAVEEARSSGEPVLGPTITDVGVRQLLAVPDTSGWVTTAAVGARSRLFPGDPYAQLVGGEVGAGAEPPYDLQIFPVEEVSEGAAPEEERWTRRGDVLHGDWLADPGGGGALAVHVEVALRDEWALAQRGTLVLLLDIAVLSVLWGAGTLSERGMLRWARRWRRRWARSYRARLSLALLGFFTVPAVAFGLWGSRQLQGDVREARELLLGEALRGAMRTIRADGAVSLDAAPGSPPLLLYRDGVLAAASDELLAALAPLGRLLPPDVALDLEDGMHTAATSLEPVGSASVLVGYRALGGRDDGTRVVLAIPARSDEMSLERRRRDLGVLVLFATAVGALAALWLSGVAARQLARPIGALREAALAIAAGERNPPLPTAPPPAEFAPVFSAFRRMAADLNASRAALEEAERRTAAVLRHVASAVVAVNADGVVTLYNPAAARLFGRALQPGVALSGLGVPELEERLARVHSGAPDAEPARAESMDAADGDGEMEITVGRRQLLAHATPLTRGEAGAVITLDDVTELARAQRVLAWGEMARQVAHEIKNPLTPIRLGVQHLRRAYLAGRGDYESVLTQNVERILAEIDRLDEIARAFSRYGTAPEDRPAGAPVDACAVARDVVELERMGGDGFVSWRLEAAGEPCMAIAREDELREVLLNVLENARLARAREVSVRVEPPADGRVRLVVTDDGEGVPPSLLPRLFEPRFSTRTSGSGLGLAISRRLVEAWGGTMSLRSTPGEGTEVEIALAAATE
ncbi:MAG TPA: ATP-binding protein, partial [Gemmatimonadales bacterium]